MVRTKQRARRNRFQRPRESDSEFEGEHPEPMQVIHPPTLPQEKEAMHAQPEPSSSPLREPSAPTEGADVSPSFYPTETEREKQGEESVTEKEQPSIDLNQPSPQPLFPTWARKAPSPSPSPSPPRHSMTTRTRFSQKNLVKNIPPSSATNPVTLDDSPSPPQPTEKPAVRVEIVGGHSATELKMRAVEELRRLAEELKRKEEELKRAEELEEEERRKAEEEERMRKLEEEEERRRREEEERLRKEQEEKQRREEEERTRKQEEEKEKQRKVKRKLIKESKKRELEALQQRATEEEEMRKREEEQALKLAEEEREYEKKKKAGAKGKRKVSGSGEPPATKKRKTRTERRLEEEAERRLEEEAKRREEEDAAPEEGDAFERFIDEEAAARFKALEKRVLWMEKGFEGRDLPVDVAGPIRQLGWARFAAPLPQAIPQLVKEFYANSIDPELGVTLVREVPVVWSADTIREALSLPQPPSCAYQKAVREVTPESLEEALRVVGKPNAAWTTSGAGAKTIKHYYLTPQANVWAYFLKSRIIPTSHDTTLTRDRVLLLACILKGEQIDVAEIIFRELQLCMAKKAGILIFPNLITLLCTLQEVPGIREEAPSKEILTIDSLLMERLMAPEVARRSAAYLNADVLEMMKLMVSLLTRIDARLGFLPPPPFPVEAPAVPPSPPAEEDEE